MDDPCVTKPVISVAVTGHGAVCIRLAGDIDNSVEPNLIGLCDNLAVATCSILHIDLHEITSADSSLLNFVVRLAGQLPDYALVTLCRPSSLTLHMIEGAGLHKVHHIRHDLPADWISAADANAEHPGADRP